MNIRLWISIIVLFVYVMLYNVYIYYLKLIPLEDSRIFFNLLTFGAVSYFVWDLRKKIDNPIHRKFNLLLISSVLVNYVIIIFTYVNIFKLTLNDTSMLFFAFDGAVAIITFIIFCFGMIHDNSFDF